MRDCGLIVVLCWWYVLAGCWLLVMLVDGLLVADFGFGWQWLLLAGLLLVVFLL